jgi:hypothetical protein
MRFLYCYEIIVAVTTTQVRRSSSSHIITAPLWVFLVSGLLSLPEKKEEEEKR